jgi:hypothetical protein
VKSSKNFALPPETRTVGAMKSALAETELVEISRKLRPKQRRELVRSGQTLCAQVARATPARALDENGDAAWEKIIADPKPRPKLRAFVERVLREERAEPMDVKRL